MPDLILAHPGWGEVDVPARCLARRPRWGSIASFITIQPVYPHTAF